MFVLSHAASVNTDIRWYSFEFKNNRLNRGNIIELKFYPLCDGDIFDCDKSDNDTCVNWHMIRNEQSVTSH